jgi:predicted neutral ceramidase superfamily lipid hydrolase
MADFRKVLRSFRPRHIVILAICLLGIVFTYSGSEKLHWAGILLFLIGGLASWFSSRALRAKSPPIPFRKYIQFQLIALASAIAYVIVYLLFPVASPLRPWISGLVFFAGLSFGFWFLVFCKKPRNDEQTPSAGQ